MMWSGARSVSLLSLVALALLVAALPGRAAIAVPEVQQDWPVECVDCPPGIEPMADHALRLDADGHAHIAFGGEHLYYAHHDGTAWQIEVVDPAQWVGEGASLALDAAGAPHIVYDAPGEHAVRYAWHDGTSWHIETVDGAVPYPGGRPSIALDAAGDPQASYYDSYQGRLKYAWRDDAAWHVEVVDGTRGVIGSTSLAIDAHGHPHISYGLGGYPGPGQDSVRYAHHDGAGWHLETVYTGTNYGMETSLALDAADVVHILLTQVKDYEGEDGAVFYARQDGTAWQIETVATGDLAAPALVLDTAGAPHIAFQQDFWALGGVRYGWKDGAGWHVEAVPDPARVGRSISLAIDAAGRPQLAYLDEPAAPVRHLKHAWYDGSAWHTEYVAYGESRGGDVSLAVDGSGQPHIAYQDTFQHWLMYAGWMGGVWATEYVDTDGFIEAASLALDAAGEPHMAYSAGEIRHAWRDSAGWHVETVDGEGWGGIGPSLAFDPLGDAYIGYGHAGARLRLAWHDGTAWQIETVWEEGDYVWSTELAFDPAGHPHIVFETSQFSDTLRYAWHDGSAWHFEIVVPESAFASVAGFAVDRAGRSHLLYSKDGVTWYAWRDGSGWSHEPAPCRADALTLDAGDRPHLSCIGLPGVTHAWHDGAGWRTERVTPTPYWGWSSLDVDKAGVPHIAFSYSHLADRLLYARRPSPLFYVVKEAEPRDGVASGDAITYTLALYGPGVEAALWDPLPANVEYVSGTLTVPAEYSPTARAVLWHGVLPTDTAQVLAFQVTAAFGGMAPEVIANTAWLTDVQAGTVSRGTVVVNSHRAYLPVVVRDYWYDW